MCLSISELSLDRTSTEVSGPSPPKHSSARYPGVVDHILSLCAGEDGGNNQPTLADNTTAGPHIYQAPEKKALVGLGNETSCGRFS
jgi:hypothetical protein